MACFCEGRLAGGRVCDAEKLVRAGGQVQKLWLLLIFQFVFPNFSVDLLVGTVSWFQAFFLSFLVSNPLIL